MPDIVPILESPEEVLTTMTREGKRRWLYPVPEKGAFYKKRLIVGWGLIVLFLAFPLIPIGGKPAVLLDLIRREFTFFGVTFYPTDTLLLMLFLISILLTIIIITALLGRVWCGWGCPQTVYLEFVFRPIERWLEGSENKRRRQDERQMTFDVFLRKSAKWVLYLVISLVLAHSFVAYFVGWKDLIGWITEPPTAHWGFFVIMALVTALILFDFGYFREQMCTIACPYARMQSIMLDRDSMIVSYDLNRGEPRAKRSKKKMQQEKEGLIPAQGDCIDCFACVRTCPTGIDIREGLQMECITCTQCIDACDHIMDRIGKPRGLIRYTSENDLEGKPAKLIRPRTVLYAGLFLLVSSLFTIALVNRGTYDVNVGRVVGAPFTELPDGNVANRLRFRVRNQTAAPVTFTVEAVSPPEAKLTIVGVQPIPLEPQEMKRTEIWISIPASAFEFGNSEGVFELRFSDGYVHTVTFPLLGPS